MDLMIDIETLGTEDLPVVLSVGALAFERNGDGVPPPDDFYDDYGGLYYRDGNVPPPFMFTRIRLESCLDAGMAVGADALRWWTRDALASARMYTDLVRREDVVSPNLGPALQMLHDYVSAWRNWSSKAPDDERRILRTWSHGATFDISILDRAYALQRAPSPFDYRLVRDTRTLFDALNAHQRSRVWPEMPPEATPHHPLWDCWRQAVAVQNACRHIRGDERS